MKVRLYADETIALDLHEIKAGLTISAPSISWELGVAPFRIATGHVESPKTYQALSKELLSESDKDDYTYLFTEKPYDNNYFWESDNEKTIIVSLYGWDHLTSLPRNNGAIYFIVALLVRSLRIGQSHSVKNTGCINDFWRDKTGVDSGMRSAYICTNCLPANGPKTLVSQSHLLKELMAVLDQLSSASRANLDICANWIKKSIKSAFQVFLCHNSLDKDEIHTLNAELKTYRIKTWLDEEQLPPGRAWQEQLEEQIQDIGSVAVFVGESGLGPWQNNEMRAFIAEFVNRRCPVIPVILKSCKTVPQLPILLRQFTWVDFRKPEPDPIERLIWGITGTKLIR